MKNIFTAQKTVLALAVAGLMSSGAFAASQSFSEVTIGEGSAISVNGNQLTDTKVTGTVEGKLTDDGKTATFKDGDSTTDIDLNGGSFSVSAVAEDKTASPVVNAAAGSYTLESLGEHATGTLNITALNGSKADEAKSATLTIEDGVFNKGDLVINFDHLGTETAVKGQAILTADNNKPMNFGTAEVVDEDTGLITTPAKLTTFIVTADTDAVVGGANTPNVNLTNVTINNAGKLTFDATNIALVSDIDLSGSTGVTIFDGASTVTGDFTGSKVVMGAADDDDNLKNFNQIFTGDVTVNGGVFTAQDMTVAGNQLMVTADGEFVVDGTMTITGGKSEKGDAYHHQFNGTQTFKDVVIATTADSEGNAYVNVGKNNAKTSFTAQTLKVSGVTGHAAGFYVNDGDAEIGSVEIGANGGFGTWGGTTTIDSLIVNGEDATVDFAKGDAVVGDLMVNKGTVNVTKATSDGESVSLTNVTLAKDATFTINDANADVTISGKLSTGDATNYGTFTLTTGTLTTAGANLLSYDSNEDELADAISLNAGVTVNGGTVNLTDEVDYTIDAYKAVKDNLGTAALTFVNGKIWGLNDAGEMDKTVKVTGAALKTAGIQRRQERHSADVFRQSSALG